MFLNRVRDGTRRSPQPESTTDDATSDSGSKPGGNSVWHQIATRGQAKLEVDKPGDPLEREADDIARQAMLPEPGTTSSLHPHDDRAGTSNVSQSNEPTHAAPFVPGPGHPLSASARAAMETRLGHDFGSVRVHDSGDAAESARAFGARAYTAGRDIVFADGQYQPTTREGQTLLAHELAHVIQQGSATSTTGHDRSPSPAASHGTPLQRQVYGPAATTGAGTDFDEYLLQMTALEEAAIKDGYSFKDRVTAFRKVHSDSPAAAKKYAGAVIGGGVWNILIPGAASTKLPPSWTTKELAGSVDYLRKHQTMTIAGQLVDISHLLTGADAANHPTALSLAGGMVKMRSNVEAATFIGDLGSVVTEYIKGSKASFRDTAMKRSPVLDSYYDGANAQATVEDMAGNADAYSLKLDPSKTVAENLRAYYAATTDGVKKRYTGFAAAIGLGTLNGTKFSGDTAKWRAAMRDEVFNSALAYAAARGWKGDVINVFQDPGPGVFVPTFWEMYFNVSGWVVDIFVDRIAKSVAKE